MTPKIPKDMIKDFEEWVAANHDKMVDVFLKLMKAASEDNAPPMNVMDFVKYLKILRCANCLFRSFGPSFGPSSISTTK